MRVNFLFLWMLIPVKFSLALKNKNKKTTNKQTAVASIVWRCCCCCFPFISVSSVCINACVISVFLHESGTVSHSCVQQTLTSTLTQLYPRWSILLHYLLKKTFSCETVKGSLYRSHCHRDQSIGLIVIARYVL